MYSLWYRMKSMMDSRMSCLDNANGTTEHDRMIETENTDHDNVHYTQVSK